MKKILIFALISVLIIGCSTNDDSEQIIPEIKFKVETNSVINLGHLSATVIGRFNPSFENEVSAYGICYGLSPNPTISGAHTIATNYDEENGSFSSNLSPLSQNTTYYVRAYGTTSGGTLYGDQITFSTLGQLFSNASSVTDVDGNTYPSIIINTKQWMKTNLNVSKYRNGDVIPQVTDLTQWDNLTTGAWCYYANDTANGTIYGKLYNWYAVNDPRGLAPAGWHIPTDQEWTSLTTFLGGNTIAAGSKMRDPGTLWSPTAAIATNQSGFSALPAGYGYLTFPPENQITYEAFLFINNVAYWWTATEINTPTSWTWNVNLNNQLTRSNVHKKAGLSVRCVKN